MIAEISKWLVLAIIVIVVIFIIKTGTKIINIIITVLLLAFVWFSFFTEVGAARLSLALKGHPIIAYTAKVEKDETMSKDNITYYRVIDATDSKGNKIESTSCETFWIVRIPVVEVK